MHTKASRPHKAMPSDGNASARPRSTDSYPTSNRGQHEIDEALDRKRRQLEKEIEEFKAAKEQEYKLYEQVMRERSNSASMASLRNNGLDAGQEDSSDEHKHEGHSKRNEKDSAALKEQEPYRVSEAPNGQTDSPSSPSASTNSSPSDTKTRREDRESELRGFFTPSFLPLLEDSSRKSHNGHRKSGSTTGSHHRSRHSAPSPLSFSLTLPSTTYDPLNSPSHPETPQPSSAPRPSVADRRSSSRSDTSPGASLRSSMRQPKSPEQLPRERKHVLFSIDNIVMSPSSSPIAYRSKQPSPDPPPSDSDISFGKINRKLRADGIEPQLNFASISATPLRSPSFGAPTSPSSASFKSYHNLIEPTVSTPPEELEQGDLEPFKSEDDPLFSLDDEDSATKLPNDDDFEDVSEADADDDDDTDLAGIEPVVESTMVGSLPIEIKYPSRPK